MITAQQCLDKYGMPNADIAQPYLKVWAIPETMRKGRMPTKIYCNKDIIPLLEKAFTNLVERGLWQEWKTYNGCYNVRCKRGADSWSIHSWAMAIDINAADNPFDETPTMSEGFVKCFTDVGFDWGGKWKKPDGMHFQPKKL